MGSRFRPATNEESVFALIAGLPTKGYRLGKKAKRTYLSSYGPWDAELVDHVYGEVQRFLDSGMMKSDVKANLLWNRALSRWELGKYEEALKDAQEAHSLLDEERNGRWLISIRCAIRLIMDRRPVAAMAEYADWGEGA